MGAFKLRIKKPNLTWYQEEILYNPARFTITEASTKAGKTHSHIWWIFERAHADWNKPGYNHWWVAPVYSQAAIAYERLKNVIRSCGATSLYKFNESKLTIVCPNGAVIHFKTAKDHNNLFGEDVYSVVFDEAPRAKVDAFYALRSTVTATNAPIKMIGNFGGVSNWMHILKQKAETDPEYQYYRINAWDAVKAGILKREEIEQAQQDLPPKVFKALYMAEEQESEDQLVTYDSMRDLLTNTHVKGTERFITADIALHGSDKFVVLVWEGFRVIDIQVVDKCEADEVEKLLKETAEKWKVGRSNIVYDADGLGSFLRGYLKGAKPFNNGGKPIPVKGSMVNYKNLKTQCGYKLANMINAKELFFDCEIDEKVWSNILQELECLQSYALDNEGKIQLLPKAKIKELIGRSPDVLDAIMMRMFFVIKPKKKAPKSRTV